MARKILIGTVSVIVLFLVIGFFLPSKWTVERSVMIEAPPESIYPLVANLKEGWAQWSDFDYQDPDIKYSYTGPEIGVGASRSWVSPKMGNGTQTITKADPTTGVEFDFVMDNQFFVVGEMKFVPEGTSTKVTWKDSGDVGYNPLMRYMVLFMDKMMGPSFEKSLQTLKQKSEATPQSPAAED